MLTLALRLVVSLYGIFVTITRFCLQTLVPLFDNK